MKQILFMLIPLFLMCSTYHFVEGNQECTDETLYRCFVKINGRQIIWH